MKNQTYSKISFTRAGSSDHDPLIHTPLRLLFLRLAFIIKWKYLVLQSPSLIHLDLAFCLSKDSCDWAALHKSSWSCFLVIISLGVRCLSPVLVSNLFSSSSIFLYLLKVLPNCSLFHAFNFCFRLLIFSFNTYPPQPLCWLELHDSWTIFLNELSENQQSKILKGLGPQSTYLALRRIGQWYEKFLG